MELCFKWLIKKDKKVTLYWYNNTWWVFFTCYREGLIKGGLETCHNWQNTNWIDLTRSWSKRKNQNSFNEQVSVIYLEHNYKLLNQEVFSVPTVFSTEVVPPPVPEPPIKWHQKSAEWWGHESSNHQDACQTLKVWHNMCCMSIWHMRS